MGTDASLIGDDQIAFADNLSLRGDLITTRPPRISIPLDTRLTGLYQGAGFYETQDQQGIVTVINGRFYFIQITPTDSGTVADITPQLPITTTADFTVPAPAAVVNVSVASETPFAVGDTVFIDSGEYTVTNRFTNQLQLTYIGSAANATVDAGASVLDANGDQVIQSETYPTSLDFVNLFQAEKYMIALGLQQKPVIFDGTSSKLAGINQIPSGVLGLYAWGRLWIVLPDLRSFVAGDIVYGPSGTAQAGFVDAILSFTENDFLNEGGFFTVPNNSGPITAMIALATIDTSLGIGPILVGTANSVASVNAPVDRTTWKNLTYPIQTLSLIDYGPVASRAFISINNDVWYRAVDGIRSFIVGRRNMAGFGNTPLSHEISPVLSADTPDLLRFCSAVLFDNKALFTVAPRRTSSGIVHDGLAVINFDSLSTIANKQPPVWEGFQSGLSILQLIRGRIRGEERAFAFALNESSDTIELWELLTENAGFYDTYRSVSGNDTTLVRTPIGTTFETKRYEYERLVKLVMGELYLDDIVDEVTLTIKFRPDEYPSWLTWATITLCANVTQCTITTPDQFSCQVWKPNARGYAARIRLPAPPETCNALAGIPVDTGYAFQFRFEVTGHYQMRKFRPHLRIQSDSQSGECPTQAVCTTFEQCDTPWFSYEISRGPAENNPPTVSLGPESTADAIIINFEQSSQPTKNEVWRSQDGGDYLMLAIVDGDLSSYTDTTGLPTHGVWSYKVRSVRGGEFSEFSDEVTIVRDIGDFNYFGTEPNITRPTWQIAIGNFGIWDTTQVSAAFAGLRVITGPAYLYSLNMTSLTLDNLESVNGDFELEGSDLLPSLNLPELTTINGTFNVESCDVLTSVSVPKLVIQNGQLIDFFECALDAASVNGILARAVASGVTSAEIDLSGPSMAAPTGQGILDKAALIAAGNTITTN